jgi:hypothetical protein
VPVLKNIAVIPLLIAFAAQSFSGAFIQLGYAINPAAFAKYCVNKAKPKLHCNGKCQMMKKMKEEEKKEQENTENKLDYKITILSSKSFYCTIASSAIIADKVTPVEIASHTVDITLSIFHPPRL